MALDLNFTTGSVFLAAFFVLFMTGAWCISLKLRFVSLIDVAWALGIAAGALTVALLNQENLSRLMLISVLAMGWGGRLGWHLLLRLKAHYPKEDARYQVLIQGWGADRVRRSFLVFQFQALTQFVFSYPFLVLALDSSPFPRLWELIGASVALVGWVGETLSDAQLKRFKANAVSRGAICEVGLWRYSRHPNYFFEWVIWCGFAICAWGAPGGWLSWIAPALMLFLLLFVTGVKPTEIQALQKRGDAYRNYQARTSAFFPWPPKQKKGESNRVS